ncbi:hypothetical protein H4R18_003367 [Coemansia javaensis]|uniref:Uncharacterized protein n=1 Tax=Coemansia javaensis TaxID=2761396 RepID=A0A9W8H871_9FUNG|nr:hypothetical protein H4R18_003367 [Coemansia javaensis]
MQIFATLVIAATAAFAQQIGSDQGPTVASGPSAVDNPNVNNGQQFTNSVVDTSSKGGNVFEGLTGNTFTDSISNFGASDNNVINPQQTHVQGNSGPTANGQDNFLGNFFADGRGFFHRRDAVFNNNYGAPYAHAVDHVGFAHAYAPHPAAVYQPVYAHPAIIQAYQPVHPAAYALPRVERPVHADYPVRPEYPAPHAEYPAAHAEYPVAHAGYPAAHINHNVQSASIVQNQA